MGTEPTLVQRPSLARAEIPEVTAKQPILENPPANRKATGETVLCRMTRLQARVYRTVVGRARWARVEIIYPAKQSVQALLRGQGLKEGKFKKTVHAVM